MSAPLYNQEQLDIALVRQKQDLTTQTLIHIEKRMDHIDQRMDKIDTDVKDVRKEVRSNFYWLLSSMAGLGVIIAHGFKWF